MLISGLHTTGYKRPTAVALQTTYDYVFTDIEFFAALGATLLEGPFQLSIDIENNYANPIFVGIIIETTSGSITSGERRHIAFVPSSQRVIIAGTSVPQLNAIYGTVKKITVRTTLLTGYASDSQVARVALRFDAALPAVGAQPYLGLDLQGIARSVPFLYLPIILSYQAAPGAGSGIVTQWTYTVPAGKWAELLQSFVLIDANAAAANTLAGFVQAVINGVAMRVNSLSAAGAVNHAANSEEHRIHLSEADTVSGVTFNGSAVNPAIHVSAMVKEYI